MATGEASDPLGDAFELVLGLVNRGVRIVQLSPTVSILAKPVNMTALMLAVVELSRANSESETKARRVGEAWSNKREETRDGRATLTATTKSWCEVKEGKVVFRPGARALLRRIFRLATDGHGCRTIARRLIADGTPTWNGKEWDGAFLRTILRGREVLGELQMCRRTATGRVPDGEPVKGYYPAAVTEAEWLAAQTAMAARISKGGRPAKGGFVSIFRGLLRDARTGEALHIQPGRAGRVLKPSGSHTRGRTGQTQFPLDVFERAVIRQLGEVDPRELFDAPESPDEVAELSAKLARLDTQIQALADAFDADDVIPEVAAKLKAKHAERKATAEALEKARANAASPLSSVWGETRGLAESLDAAKGQPDIRVRLRQAISRTVESVRALFVRRDGILVAGVQLRFVGTDRTRDYVVWYHSWAKRWGALCASSDVQPRPEVLEACAALGIEPNGFDFTNPAHLPEIEDALRAYADYFHAAHEQQRVASNDEKPRWSEEEIAAIGTATDREIAKRLGRTIASVRGKRREMRKRGQWKTRDGRGPDGTTG